MGWRPAAEIHVALAVTLLAATRQRPVLSDRFFLPAFEQDCSRHPEQGTLLEQGQQVLLALDRFPDVIE